MTHYYGWAIALFGTALFLYGVARKNDAAGGIGVLAIVAGVWLHLIEWSAKW